MTAKDQGSEDKIFGTDMDATISAAWLYYHHDLTQAEIAKQLRVSRPTVANLLARRVVAGLSASRCGQICLAGFRWPKSYAPGSGYRMLTLFPRPMGRLRSKFARR